VKRPLLIVAMGIVFGVILSYVFGLYGTLYFCLGILILVYKYDIRRIIVVLLAISFLCGFILTYSSLTTTGKNISLLTNQTLTYRGTVEKLNIHNNYMILTLNHLNEMSDDYFVMGKMSLIMDVSSMDDNIHIGDNILFETELESLRGANNPNGFNEQLYNYGNGIFYSGFTEEVIVQSNDLSMLQSLILKSREVLLVQVARLWEDDTLGMVKTMLLGESNAIDEDIKLVYQKVGLAHLLAISGLHLSIIVLGLYKLIKKRLRPCSEIIMMFFIIYYIGLTGNHLSTIRAGLMVGMFLTSYLLSRKYDPISSISGAVIIIVLMNPFQLFQVGFLLSFFAVIGLVIVGPIIEKSMNKLLGEHYIWQLMAPLVGIQIMTLPVQIYYFYGVPLYSIIVNLIVIPFVIMFLVLGIFSIGVSFITLSMGHLIGNIAALCNHIIIAVATFTSELPLNYINIKKPDIWMLIIYYAIVLGMIIWAFGENKENNIIRIHMNRFVRLRRFKVLILVCILSVIIISCFKFNRLTIINFDVGQGDSSVITFQQKVFLIDTGGDTTLFGSANVGADILFPYFLSEGIDEIEGVFISHSDFDHIYGLIEIMPTIRINHVYLPAAYRTYEDNMLNMLKELMVEYDIKCHYMKAGDSVIYNELSFNCIYPYSGEVKSSNNDHSMVLQVTKGRFDYLFTGDISEVAEGEMLKYSALTEVEGLKVAHHGSSSSSQLPFISTVNPSFALISYGDHNFYGHPSSKTLEYLETNHSTIYKTAEDGALILYYDGFMGYYMGTMYGKRKDYYLCKP
jgi:competence protein ComEC